MNKFRDARPRHLFTRQQPDEDENQMNSGMRKDRCHPLFRRAANKSAGKGNPLSNKKPLSANRQKAVFYCSQIIWNYILLAVIRILRLRLLQKNCFWFYPG